MRLNQINVSNDAIEAISDRSINENGIVEDLKILITNYSDFFKNDLNSLDWDHFCIEFWFDSGQIILYPEKKTTFEDQRLEPYMYLVFEKYQAYFDSLLENNISDAKIDREADDLTITMISHIMDALNSLKNKLLEITRKQKLLFKYYGVTKEILLSEQWIESSNI